MKYLSAMVFMVAVAAALAQPRVGIIAPSKFSITNQSLVFDLAITNAGDRTFIFADRLQDPRHFTAQGVVKDTFEIVLLNWRGDVVSEQITEAAFVFKNQDRPSIAPKERVATRPGFGGGVFDLKGISNGIYILTVRLNPDGLRWPVAFFKNEVTHTLIRITGKNVARHTPPRPVLAHPKPPARVIAYMKKNRPILPPWPGAAAPAARGLKKPIYPGRTPR